MNHEAALLVGEQDVALPHCAPGRERSIDWIEELLAPIPVAVS